MIDWLPATHNGVEHYWARAFGIQEIIFHDRCWTSMEPSDRAIHSWSDLSAQAPCAVTYYGNHIHLTLHSDGAEGNTPGYQAPPSVAGGMASLVSTSSGSEGTFQWDFDVPEGYPKLLGRIRFLSDEYPEWYGSEYNDSWIVYLSTTSGIRLLGQGNLNSSSWGGGVAGFNAATPVMTVEGSLAGLEGTDATLVARVSDVGDADVDSALALEDFTLDP